MNVENLRTKREVEEVSLTEVTAAKKQMKRGKSVGSNAIQVEAWKCRGIKLMSHSLKIWERGIEKRLRVQVSDQQIPRQEVWNCLRLKEVEEKHIRLIKDVYERSKMRVKCIACETGDFKAQLVYIRVRH
ncbi:uncharacterized protein LOC122253896 [Penaeus japonicus]|uniref:uncharacterized protein LOC122253896 n=1 Tax=Penaeus japonicus TaxID=27405 RepID=UPI001C7123E7|nr:uncharacterized protein LOC122253896 [Penaeus japonicus]